LKSNFHHKGDQDLKCPLHKNDKSANATPSSLGLKYMCRCIMTLSVGARAFKVSYIVN